MTPRMDMISAPDICTRAIALPEESTDKVSANSQQNSETPSNRHHLARLVSQDEFTKDYKDADRIMESKVALLERSQSVENVPPLPNPLDDPLLLKIHLVAVRLESDLYPLRLVISRLMAHPTHNRKGIFNDPVDPVALGLPDYHRIVKHPMDLGTVKRRLHSIAYKSRDDAVRDIRLVFTNAMLYNPPHNAVHIAAKALLSDFESFFRGFCCEVSDAPPAEALLHSSSPSVICAKIVDTPPRKFDDPSENENFAYASDMRSLSFQVVESPSRFSFDRSELPGSVYKNIRSQNRNDPTLAASPTREKEIVPSQSRIRRPKQNPKPGSRHYCEDCQGRICSVCKQGCLQHEPALLVCSGVQCAGSKIRKGAVYFTTRDGSHQYCDRCYVGLPSTLFSSTQNEACRYRQDLLKRRNDEQVFEQWIVCGECAAGVHVICAMHNIYVHTSSRYRCPGCRNSSDPDSALRLMPQPGEDCKSYSFISGSEAPVPMESIRNESIPLLDADSLRESAISNFIEEKVKDAMKTYVNSGATIKVRLVSDCERQFQVPKVVGRYFRVITKSPDDSEVPPKQVQYRQKAIVMFQKIDGLDVCVFCMYVQEYDDDSPDKKRVYIAYIDSVEHFRPRELRTQVFHEILISYLATARERGFCKAHIWACPPSRGNSFVFWNHPSSQRVPTVERLQAWYHGALSRAAQCGVVVDVKSLYESDFEEQLAEVCNSDVEKDSTWPRTERMLCPPLIDGDFWIEEAARVHQAAIDRNLKVRSPSEVCVWNVGHKKHTISTPCPALQVASLLKDRIMAHPSSAPFRRPVNAASLKLKDYHKIIQKPVDLGTIYSRCILGEYYELQDVAHDVIQMVSNAKKFNPPGHVVCSMATEVWDLFNSELNNLVTYWGDRRDGSSWENYAMVSMSLDNVIEFKNPISSPEHDENKPVVIIEDDRSSDGSRSMTSSAFTENSSSDLGDARLQSTKKAKPRRLGQKKTQEHHKILDLLVDGPGAVMQRMAGNDIWLLDKRSSRESKSLEIQSNKRPRVSSGATSGKGEPETKRRRQSWLCEEVGLSVRMLRTSFFTCSLALNQNMSKAEKQKLEVYKEYVKGFQKESETDHNTLADARSAILELSQFRNFEFNTLRRAKYSTSMLLYHIVNSDAPGGVPSCTSCGEIIKEVRWHKANGISATKIVSQRKKKMNATDSCCENRPAREDLCASCFERNEFKDDFVPFPVSSKSGQSSK